MNTEIKFINPTLSDKPNIKSEGLKILSSYLGLAEGFDFKISISHGVDFGIYKEPQDINNVQPIHWSYNQKLFDRSLKYKQTVKIPHPFLILIRQNKIIHGEGTILIGPPPSQHNDEGLYKIIKERGIRVNAILIKNRNKDNAYKSIQFWHSKQINTIVAKSDNHYQSLFDILNGYQHVISPVFSSVLIFAGAMKKKCSLLEGYCYRNYETFQYIRSHKDEISQSVGYELANILLSGGYKDFNTKCLETLGNNLEFNREKIKQIISKEIKNIKEPIFVSRSHMNFIRKLLVLFIKFTNFHSFSQLRISEVISHYIFRNIILVEACDIDIMISGANSRSLKYMKVAYKKGVTEPGVGA